MSKSKVELAKINQGYIFKPMWPVCGNCKHFSSRLVQTDTVFGKFTDEKEKRCTVGEFKTGKTSTCKMHEPQPQQAEGKTAE